MKKKIILFPFAALLLTLSCAHLFAAAAPILVDAGKKVKLNYTMKADGQVVETTVGKQPFEFVYGEQHIFAPLEKAIKGLSAGEHKQVTLQPEEAFGPVNPKAIVEVPRAQFKEQEIKAGMVFTSAGKDGAPVHGTVQEIKKDTVVLNLNHPLAGKVLDMEVDIVAVG